MEQRKGGIGMALSQSFKVGGNPRGSAAVRPRLAAAHALVADSSVAIPAPRPERAGARGTPMAVVVPNT